MLSLQAVNYIDRYLTLQTAQRSQLQLIGVTCMWVAAKYEEIYPPNVSGEWVPERLSRVYGLGFMPQRLSMGPCCLHHLPPRPAPSSLLLSLN